MQTLTNTILFKGRREVIKNYIFTFLWFLLLGGWRVWVKKTGEVRERITMGEVEDCEGGGFKYNIKQGDKGSSKLRKVFWRARDNLKRKGY